MANGVLNNNIPVADPGATFENVRHDKRNDFFCFLSDFDTPRDHPPIIESHYHSYVEMIYIISGRLSVTIDSHDFTCYPGDLVVILPGEVHSFERRHGLKYLCIQTDPQFIFSGILTATEYGSFFKLRNTIEKEDHIFRENLLDGTNIPRSIANIAEAHEKRGKFHRLRIRTALSTVALFVLESWDKKYFEKQPNYGLDPKIAKLAPVLEVIHKDYKTGLRGEELAKMLGMSTSYFSRLFSNAMGMGFTEYINYIKINEAERLLVSTDMPIAEIAQEVGFSNTSYFIAKFREQFNMSPKKYQRTYSNR